MLLDLEQSVGRMNGLWMQK